MASENTSPTVLFLNLPPKTFIGIDLISFNSSPNFQGITNISTGFHFLYTGTDASLAIRNGRWLHVQPGTTNQTIYVLKWINEEECLTLLDGNSDEALSVARLIPEIRQRGLVDFAALQDASSEAQSKNTNGFNNNNSDPTDWKSLTSHISTRLLTRILTSSWTISSISSAPSDTESIPGLTHLESSSFLQDSSLNVLLVNLKQTWPDGAIGRDRTDKARDRSWYLSYLIESLSTSVDKRVGASEILGELQMCFLMILTLANWSCMEQWKRILSVLLTCKQALIEVEGYFVEAVEVLTLQLQHVEDVDGGMFDLRDELNSLWLRKLLAKFRRNVSEALGDGSDLMSKLRELESFMNNKYGWENGNDVLRKGMIELEDGESIEVSMDGLDEEEETGEYAPVIVET